MIHFLFSKRFLEIDFIRIKNPAIHETTPRSIENVPKIEKNIPDENIFEFIWDLLKR